MLVRLGRRSISSRVYMEALHTKKRKMSEKNKKQICLFGLSADPVTGEQGHVGIVKELLRIDEYFDEIWILPVYIHTYVSKRQRLVSFEHRLAMCHAAFDGLDDTRVKVSDAERRSWEYHAARNNPEDNNDTFSVGTGALLEYLRIEYQNQPCCFSFCVGADAFLDLMNGKWNEGRRVLDLLENGKRLLVLHRASNDCDASHSTTTDLNSKVDAAGARLIQMGSLGSISSSQVRECQDLKQLSTMIVPSVLEYIKSNKLYQFANS